ncbi:hypothetical protein [Stanieria cyanosphaera]|nr:hypothetical protein [Stanieria cyanosphaera]
MTISQYLRSANCGQLSSANLRQAWRQPVAIAGDEGLKLLTQKLQSQVSRLGTNIHSLLELTRHYWGNTKPEHYLDSNGGLELYSMDESTMILKLSRDLLYFRRYIQEQAQISKIERDLFRVYESAVYFQRLHQYLDTLPETANNLIDTLSSRWAR